MNPAEDPSRQQEIQSSLRSIMESSENWLGRLRKREFRVRLASSFLTTILVFAVAGGASLAIIILTFGWTNLAALFRNSGEASTLAGLSFLAGVLSGIARYFFLRRKHNRELKGLSSLISEMKTKIGAGTGNDANPGNGSAVGITPDAISLAEKIVTLLPELVRKRNQDSLLFGIVAFVLVLIFGNNFPIAILVGVLVWLYFRYEFTRTYEKEISRFEEQKKIFEQRKNDFIKTL